MKLIIDIPEDRYKEIVSGIFDTDGYFKTNLTLAFRNGTPIPDNTTNGDVIKAMTNFIGVQDEENTIKISTNWWNAPYQKGGNK